jgi:two-component system, chemotaxis family, chemotaxis protein CheY
MTGTILVVDDSGLARRSARRILEGAGYDVIEAEDGLSALEQYFVQKPAVVVLDLVMRGMYGLDVLNKLREIDPVAKVIVLSADVQTSSRDLVETGGASAFINKPVQPAALLAAVEDALRGPR